MRIDERCVDAGTSSRQTAGVSQLALPDQEIRGTSAGAASRSLTDSLFPSPWISVFAIPKWTGHVGRRRTSLEPKHTAYELHAIEPTFWYNRAQ